ncbi:MAG: hypothetical protein H0V43_09165, partial [Gemmatimonadales bacterium]|nr:hypothetical protein [Gemmatimonadales bacterium]
HKDSGLLACASDDLLVRVYDTDTRQLVRQFGPHSGVITDLAWSPDARWLVVPAADGSVRVWDLPAGQLVDAFRTAQPVTSAAFSPSGDFLATTHADSRAVFLWTNRAFFSAVFLRPLALEEQLGEAVPMPTASGPADGNIFFLFTRTRTHTTPHKAVMCSSACQLALGEAVPMPTAAGPADGNIFYTPHAQKQRDLRRQKKCRKRQKKADIVILLTYATEPTSATDAEAAAVAAAESEAAAAAAAAAGTGAPLFANLITYSRIVPTKLASLANLELIRVRAACP